MKKIIILFFAVILGRAVSLSQYVPGVNNNMTLLSQMDNYETYSNIWGWTSPDGREYVLLGHDQGTSVIDITHPLSPVQLGLIDGPRPNPGGTVWREIKTYSHYAYIVSEHTVPGGFAGVQIVDLSFLPDSIRIVQNYLWDGVTRANARAHSVSIDEQHGYLCIQGGTSTFGSEGNNGGLRLLSLADPENPSPVVILNSRYVHDSFIRNNYLFASNIFDNGHVDIWDIANAAQPRLVHSLTYPNGFSHNAAVAADSNFLYTTDEIPGGTMKTWNISVLWDNDTTNDGDIQLVSEYIGNPLQIAHNIHVNGSYGYLSHYAEGVKVLDLSTPSEPVEVGYYDTYPDAANGFVGDWGVYPHFPSGNIAVSDIETGLYVFHFDTASWGGIKGKITDAQSGNPISNVKITFLEAQKNSIAGENGFYSVKTSQGNHTIYISRLGYESETLQVSIPAHDFFNQDITLQSQDASIVLDADNFAVTENVGDSITQTLTIKNQGTGNLTVTLKDINGNGKHNRPFNPKVLGARVSDRLKGIRYQNNGMEKKMAHVQSHSGSNKKSLDVIATDTSGDVEGNSLQPDIKSLYGEITADKLNFKVKFYHPVDVDSMTIGLSLDTDQDPQTGAEGIGIYQGDIGAEYDVFVNIPPVPNFGLPANTALVFNNITGGNPVIYPGEATVNSDSSVSFSIDLSDIGNDDGNINLVGSSYYWADSVGSSQGPSSADVIPNQHHSTLGIDPNGDVSWLSLDSYDVTVEPSSSVLVTFNFNATGLQGDHMYHGIVIISSNDLLHPEISFPVTLTTNTTVGVKDLMGKPLTFAIEQNYPNPFNPTTEFRYSLDKAAFTSLIIYDVLGRQVQTLVQEFKQAGNYSFHFDASKLTSGVYYYKLTSGEKVSLKKMVLLK